MSKTVSTCILETNLVPNQPQENVFFHTLYRTMAEFPGEFVRTARSTSPIQVVAIFSTQGPDTNAAMLNIELNEQLSKIVSNAQGQPVLDFEKFSNLVISSLNSHVCNFIVSHGGQPLRTSMTMAVIEGDTLRVIHIGNTKAVLIRDGKIMALTEEQTVAHRYVQMGAISPAEENNHPERFSLTQYLGKMPQDGQIMPDKKVHLKLKDNDSLCLMGIGISKFMPARNRNAVLIKEMSTEAKAHEIITTAGNIGVKFGLSVAIIDVESTLILPGEAVLSSDPAQQDEELPYSEFSEPSSYSAPTQAHTPVTPSYSSFDEDDGETTVFNRGEAVPHEKSSKKASSKSSKSGSKKSSDKGSAVKLIIRAVIFFALFAALGFGTMYMIFRMRGMVTSNSNSTETYAQTSMYVTAEGVAVYSQASEDSTVIANLPAGAEVQFVGTEGSFTKITTNGNMTGYVLSINLTTENPNLGAAGVPSENAPEGQAADESLVFIPDSEPGSAPDDGSAEMVTESVNGEVTSEQAPIVEG